MRQCPDLKKSSRDFLTLRKGAKVPCALISQGFSDLRKCPDLKEGKSGLLDSKVPPISERHSIFYKLRDFPEQIHPFSELIVVNVDINLLGDVCGRAVSDDLLQNERVHSGLLCPARERVTGGVRCEV